ncbi:NAD-dependent protein deacylase [Alkaliphilus sp. B6464]|uniref:NAD-dependent protein deacylase n=1 Tax=Alkaliphilus sp. B6464 TaxID=2731219 RepID=UPI001BA70EF6|nr:NAD-dependent protein deacylase [Alkaliphilus sp. B6464]QUH21331.1 NAD-dependent protein deacylase [Alkaliphilus sp. B6464]
MSIDKLKEILDNSTNIVFFGGAGVSTESGIPDFRSADGIYNKKTNLLYSPEEILSHNFFFKHTEEFYKFYKEKMIYCDAKPNYAHIALAKLEDIGKLKAIITQNIDGLHQMAGSKNVLELHGSVNRNHCIRCNKFYDIEYVINSRDIPACSCGGVIKPYVVLYGEQLDDNIISKTIDSISKADTLIVGGTSLTVYPASSFLKYFKGKNLVLINKTPTPWDKEANMVIDANISDVFKKVI